MDKQKIKQSFSKSAVSYDQYADLQQEVLAKFFMSLPELSGKILDIGCGTGLLARLIAEKYHQTEVLGLDLAPGMIEVAKYSTSSQRIKFEVGDGEDLPLIDNIFNWVVSSLACQWMDLEKVFAEVSRVLKKEGRFYFATFGPETLKELKAVNWSINNFRSQQEIEELLARDFVEIKVEREIVAKNYQDVCSLLSSMKKIGSKSLKPLEQQGLMTKDKINSLLPSSAKGVVATYEILFVSCQKKGQV